MGTNTHHRHWGIEEKMPIVNALINDESQYSFHSKTLGIEKRLLRFWVDRYKRYGVRGLERKRIKMYCKEEIFPILHYMENKKISLYSTSVEFNVSKTTVTHWYNRYKSTGMFSEYKEEHKPMRKIKIPPIAPKKKLSLPILSDKKLLDRLEYLEAENAYLKKLQALVQERILRESGNK